MPLAMRPNSSIQAVFGTFNRRIGPKAYSSEAVRTTYNWLSGKRPIIARPASPSRAHDALADTHAEHAAAASHDVTRIEVACLDFPILRTQEDFEDVFL
jgi:hypothetical protein